MAAGNQKSQPSEGWIISEKKSQKSSGANANLFTASVVIICAS